METVTLYFTRRAREERTNAADASSAEARTAHMELALRLVRVATESMDRMDAGKQLHSHVEDVSGALGGAFPLQSADCFDHLLRAVNEISGLSGR